MEKRENKMNENKKKRATGRKIGRIVLIILAVYIGITGVFTVVNQILSRGELDGIVPTGQMVEVDGRMMHIRSMGDGEQTVVIMPGIGTPLPTESFAPLMRELAIDYTVVIIEYFGTGHSDLTDQPRTNANFVAEIREALYMGGFEAPFILMPHSASGAYADYFAIRYPDEVTALVLLDTVHTHEHLEGNLSATVSLMQVAQFIGTPRLLSGFTLNIEGITEENGFTIEEISNIRRFLNHDLNATTVNRVRLYNDTIIEVAALDFPDSVPVLSIRPTNPNPGSPMTNSANNEAQMLRYNADSQLVILEGNHNIHNGNAQAIRELMNKFLADAE